MKKGPTSRVPVRAAGNAWHAVSIVCGASVCEAALKVRQVRILSRDAPLLPLAECSSAVSCRCTYKHHPDRRSGQRRASDREGSLRARATRPPEQERRAPGRRRESDT
jgi:hypothetical protein